MIDYLELINKEFDAKFNFKTGRLNVYFIDSINYSKQVFHDSKKYNSLTDLNHAFENSYKTLKKITDSTFLKKLITITKEYNFPKRNLTLTDTGVKHITTFINNIDGCIVDDKYISLFKADIFDLYKNYHNRICVEYQMPYYSLFNISAKGLNFFYKRKFSRVYTDSSKYICSLSLSSIFQCDNIFNELDQQISPRQDAYYFFEKLFTSYLYHNGGIDIIKASLEYLIINFDKNSHKYEKRSKLSLF